MTDGRPPSASSLWLRRRDLAAPGILVVIMVPLYCWRVYTIPWQVSTDEVTSMEVSRVLVHRPMVGVLGLTTYFGSPAATFVFFGRLGNLLGGIDLYHMRLVHGAFGVACILLAYVFFRQFMGTINAFALSLIMGANHAMFAFNRMGMWSTTAQFTELLALLLLTYGLMQRSRTAAFMAGAVAGLGFYVYFPARILVAMSLIIMAGVWLLRPTRRRLRSVASMSAVFAVGFAMIAAPILVATANAPKQGLEYQRQQFLFYPEGQKLAEEWTHTTSPRAAWLANARDGLLTFNRRIVDHGWLYDNPGHGFVDPATGALLWLGFAVVLGRLVRHRIRGHDKLLDGVDRQRLGDLIAVVGFCMLYLSLAFLVTKAPNYQRLLIILPFVAYFAGAGLRWLADGVAAVIASRAGATEHTVSTAVIGLAVAGIVAANIGIFSDFTSRGQRLGQDVGSTGRFVEARKSQGRHTWILAADKKYLYYWWGEPYWWQGWLGFFAEPAQLVEVISPDQLAQLTVRGRFTVFLSQKAWSDYGQSFRAGHKVAAITRIVPDGHLIAVEAEDQSPDAER